MAPQALTNLAIFDAAADWLALNHLYRDEPDWAGYDAGRKRLEEAMTSQAALLDPAVAETFLLAAYSRLIRSGAIEDSMGPGRGGLAIPPTRSIGNGGGRSVANGPHGSTSTEYVDLSSPSVRQHILVGDQRGGGHRYGTGHAGKSEFPGTWSDDRVMHEISDVATDPASSFRLDRGSIIAEGTRDGIDIRVVMDSHGNITTGYPLNTRRNP